MGRTIKGVINVCNILFDDKFKVFINKMKNKFIGSLEICNDCSYYMLSDQQEKYRKYIYSRKNELTLIESKKL